MKKAALYVRVSTDEQKKSGLSVDSQIAALEEYCRENNYSIYELYNDAGISARKSYKKRPGLQRMIQACKNKEVDIVLFTKLDRFFRSVPDYYACIEQMGDVPWRAIWEDYETETASGVFKVNIMLAVSQSEADRTSERIKSVMQYKRERKELVSGNIPRGYKIVDKRPVKDAEQSPAVDAFFSTYVQTGSMKESRAAAAAYGLVLGMSSASYMLRHAESYSGVIQGIECEPYITKDECAQILAQRKIAPRKQYHDYLFPGIVYCGECGGKMGAHRIKTKKGYYCYYNCTAHYVGAPCGNKTNISETNVENYLVDKLDTIIGGYTVTAEYSQGAKKAPAHEKKLNTLQQRRERLWNAYLDGLTSKEEFAKRISAIDKEIAEIQAAMNDVVEIDTRRPRVVHTTDWKETYQRMDNNHKFAFWAQVVKKITVYGDRSIDVDM